MLIKKSAKFDINLNAKNFNGWTGFHWACHKRKKNVVDMILNIAESFKIDLALKDNYGTTAYQLAKRKREKDIIDTIERKMPKIAF